MKKMEAERAHEQAESNPVEKSAVNSISTSSTMTAFQKAKLALAEKSAEQPAPRPAGNNVSQFPKGNRSFTGQ